MLALGILSTLVFATRRRAGELLPPETRLLTWYFFFFFLSGFCSVLYELVWLRSSMAQFGVTTAMVSIVLSVFMAGLGVGSWAGGRWVARTNLGGRLPALRAYALIEFLIGVSGTVVLFELRLGHRILEHAGLSSSAGFYWLAGLWVTVALLPWCTLMGATLPVGMEAIRQTHSSESRRSFSYLYLSNVTGAVVGTIVPLFLIELLGFRGTLRIGAVCNGLIALSALALSQKTSRKMPPTDAQSLSAHSASANRTPADSSLAIPVTGATAARERSTLALLFLSGLTCMAMEVVWVRSYTPYYGTVVYAFATILSVYLLGTVFGAAVYRRVSSGFADESPVVWSLLAACALLPLVAASPGVALNKAVRLAVGVMPFTGLLGFITPMLVDRYSGGNPSKAGTAYAINVAGCILGPLVAGFGLLPFISETHALVVLTLPWLMIAIAPLRPGAGLRVASRAAICAALVFAAVLIAAGKGYEEDYDPRVVLRDSTATVLATGEGMDKELLVNGFGMTELSTITKVMAHLPLAFLDRPPRNALVICFGMGTTFRSLHSWGIPVTAVELVPSVPRLFSYYHSDGDAILQSPLSHVVIDDGRRFLERTDQEFDIITIDPPPPLQAAASSLLYSEEFYRVARRRLRPGGILQQWVPTTIEHDPSDVAGITRSLRDSFPYVLAFSNGFGVHYLCSDRPIAQRTPEELIGRMPASAADDLGEWYTSPGESLRDGARDALDDLLRGQVSTDQLIAASPRTPAITDDRPINEYYVLRWWLGHEPIATAIIPWFASRLSGRGQIE